MKLGGRTEPGTPLAALLRCFAAPRANAPIANATRLLGHVIRDAAFTLEPLFGGALEHAPFARRTAVVALGLLGEHIDLEIAVPDRSDPEDSAAWVMWTVICRGPTRCRLSERQTPGRLDRHGRSPTPLSLGWSAATSSR
jgi:hypothetical protein